MKRAIVLSGGGSKGAYQIGVWKALRKMKIKYDIVTGTSIGSVNGIMMVQKEYHKAKYLWDNISYDDIFNVKFPKKGNKVEIYKKYAVEFLKNGGMETSKIYQFMNNAYNKKKFYKSNIDYGIVTFNVSNMKPRILNKEEMKDDLIQYVLASSTCFPAFQMTQIDDDHYVDGGYYNNLPINTAIDLGADEIIAVDLGTVFFQKKIKSKKVKITYISPRNDIGSFLVFDKKQAKKSMKYGYNDAMKVYKQLDGNKYTFNKGELFKNYEKYSSKFINNLKYSLIESGTTKKIVETLLKNTIFFKLVTKKDYKFINDSINEIMEYCGELFSIDDTAIYSSSYYNYLLKKELLKCEAFSKVYIKKLMKNKKISMKTNRKAIIKYIYDEISSDNFNKIELLTIANFFQKEFLSAVYIYTLY